MLKLIIDDHYFDIDNFRRADDSLSASFTSIDGVFLATLDDLPFIDKLFMSFRSPSVFYSTNVELSPKGIFKGFYIKEYTVQNEQISISFRTQSFDPEYLNIKKMRLQKLKQLKNV